MQGYTESKARKPSKLAMSKTVSSESCVTQSKHAGVVSDQMFPQRKQPASVLRFLLEHFDKHPDAALTTADTAMLAYGVAFDAITKSQRVATMRAMRAAHGKRVALRTLDGDGPCGQLVIFNSHNVRSYGLARLKSDYASRYQYVRKSTFRSRYVCWQRGEFEGAKVAAELDTDRHRGLMIDGGPWYGFVQQYIAADSGDRPTWLHYEIRRVRELMKFCSIGGTKADQHIRKLGEYVNQLGAELATFSGETAA